MSASEYDRKREAAARQLQEGQATPKEIAAIVLGLEAEAWVMKVADDLFNTGRAAWVWDPEVADVIGLVDVNDRKRAWIVVYVRDFDFETSDEFDALTDPR